MTDDWFKYMDNRMTVGAVVLDFSAAFDVIDNKLLLENTHLLWLYITCLHMVGELLIQ